MNKYFTQLLTFEEIKTDSIDIVADAFGIRYSDKELQDYLHLVPMIFGMQ